MSISDQSNTDQSTNSATDDAGKDGEHEGEHETALARLNEQPPATHRSGGEDKLRRSPKGDTALARLNGPAEGESSESASRKS